MSTSTGGLIEPGQAAAPPELAGAEANRARLRRMLIIGLGAVVLLSIVAEVTGAQELTSSGTYGAAFRLAVPILLAGLGGLFAERAGVVNIGLEGMLILGTWFGAWAALTYGPWWGVVAAIIGGGLGGLLHAVATVTFGIDQIVSGVAINILAAGVARFLSVVAYAGATGGGATQSPRISGSVGSMTVPFLAGGDLFGWQTPNLFGTIQGLGVPVLSDVAALGRGLTTNVSWLLVIAIALVPITWFTLWRTAFGLRLRSIGEHPVAAESLGVRVYTLKYVAVTISGMLAGLGGAILVLEAAGIYREGQTGGRGFIALAALIFGNWRPGGVAAGAALFGYAQALELRSGEAVHGLLLYLAIALLATAVWMGVRRKVVPAVILGVVAVAVAAWWSMTDTVPTQFIFVTPYLTTLLVLAFFAQRLRPPAAVGRPYRRGQAG
jgi:general nucleoside transport system permease protein